MNIREITQLALDALKERKTRSILTILMVVVGSSLMVSLSGMSGGFAQFSEKQFSNLAPDVVFLSSAQQLQRSSALAADTGGPPPSPKVVLTSVVVNNVKHLPSVADAWPFYTGQLTLEAKGKSITVGIFAYDLQQIFEVLPNAKFDDGSVIRSNDPSSIMLAENIARPPAETYPLASLGQAVQAKYSFVDESGVQKVNTRSFVVRSILKVSGNPTVDATAGVPIAAANSLMDKGNRYDGIVVKAKSPDLVDEVISEVRTLYGKDIGITSAQALLQTAKEFQSGITNFMLGIAIVALLVGVIGIITTLYTSVMERTREIGTLKAIGAKSKDILSLFLSEAVVIGVMGATLGMMIGIVGGYVLTASMTSGNGGSHISPVFFPLDLAMVWFLSVGLAALAGLFPASKASKLPPILALKRE